MVSIPDWSKLSRLVETPRQNTPGNTKYLKQREADVVKQAEDHGYFLNVSRAYIESHLLEEEEEDPQRKKSVLDKYTVQEKNLGQLKMIKLVGSHLRTVGDIGMCHYLTVCNLSGNYISRFDALIACTRLVKLDLHSNQISMLPSSGFWMCMRYLQLLHLHDNPIGRLESLHNLASCPSLMALTLYDTPLSLKRNYRHHVVNSIWSLKALDSYVISDEEIIEDADFEGRFAAMHPNFAIDLCPATPEESTFEEEWGAVTEVLSDISSILAHNSPVVIIQRFVRGYIARKYLHAMHSEEEGYRAAITIQKRYRNWKGSPPPLSTPLRTKRGQPLESEELDYDTYLHNRRPGSQPISEASLPQIARQPYVPGEKSEAVIPRAPVPSATRDLDGKKHIFINLSKLQTTTLQSLQDDAVTMETLLPTEVSIMSQRESKSRKDQKRPKHRQREEKKKKPMRSVKQFFGPVVETVPSPEPAEVCTPSRQQAEGEADEIPRINFRLKGLKESVTYVDPTTEMVYSKKEAAHELRLADDEFHRQKVLEPKPSVEKRPTDARTKRVFNRVQGTMGLSCLWAVHQAYKDREKAERQASKMEHALSVKEEREAARERIKIFQDEKKVKIAREREAEQKRVLETLERREVARLHYLDKTSQMRQRSSNYLKKRQAELTFMGDFSTQNTSVSNALLRHDRQARHEDKTQERRELVEGRHAHEHEQQEVVSKYLEHRQLMRQTENAMERAALDTKMLQEANDRLMEAKVRVAQRKQRSATVEEFYPLPSYSTHSLPPLSATSPRAEDLQGLDRFNTEVMMKHGRVGRHHTSVVT